MIITSNRVLEVGKIYNQDTLKCTFVTLDSIHYNYTFKVLREASLEEFENYIEKEFPSDAHDVIRCGNYYEISTD